MTFHEITRMMLTSMDFFELRRTAARYSVPFQGVRRQKLIREVERKILAKSTPKSNLAVGIAAAEAVRMPEDRNSEGAVSARPLLTPAKKPLSGSRINTFSARNTLARI